MSASGGPFIAGSTVSLADLAVWPFVHRIEMCAREFSGIDIRGAVAAWMAAMEALPSSRVAMPESAAMLRAIREHRSLDFFDYDTYAVSECHPHYPEKNM